MVVDEAATELLRVWMSSTGVTASLRTDGLPAEAWGLILADVARHAAEAFERLTGGRPDEVLKQIVAMFIAEMQQPTDVINPARTS